MMGIHISGSSYIYGDLMSVVHSTFRPESVCKKEKQLSLLSCSLWVGYNQWIPGWTYTKHWECHRPNDKISLFLVSNILYDIHGDP